MALIREAVFGDIPALTEMLRSLFSIEKDFDFDEELKGKGLQKIIEDDRANIKVAESKHGQVIGMCSGQLTVSTAEGGSALLVEDVFVLRQWRNQGVGKKLMEAIGSWAKLMGAARLQLLADITNEHALNFYKSLGWKKTQLICLRKYI